MLLYDRKERSERHLMKSCLLTLDSTFYMGLSKEPICMGFSKWVLRSGLDWKLIPYHTFMVDSKI